MPRTKPFQIRPTILVILTFALAISSAIAQSPSGNYGSLAPGEVRDNVLAAATQEALVWHTYTVTVPPGLSSLTISVDGRGSDVDLAVKAGAEITTYDPQSPDYDYGDFSEEPNPSYTIVNPAPGILYIDVVNLIQAPASYRLSVTANAASAQPVGPQPSQNPLAPSQAADPLVGTFSGDGLTVIVQGGAGQYQGQLQLGGQSYPFSATGGAGSMSGSFTSGGSSFPFVAVLQGDVLILETGGARYQTRRQGGNPLGGTPQQPAGPVVAQGQVATLTQDNAMAFIEALEFSLAQAGYPYVFTDAERQEALQLISQAYPTLDQQEQAVLAQAREIWQRVQANWAIASDADKREFILGVFVLAFGEQYVQQFVGQSSGTAGAAGGGCGDIDSCISMYADPGTYQDMANSQGCWAAAGCSGYDSTTDTFTYDSYE